MPPEQANGPTVGVPIPRVGMLATVRNRRGIVAAVEPFAAGPDGQLHLTTVEYLDADGQALEDSLVWEREPGARLLEPSTPPDVLGAGPMVPHEFDAFVRATRWSAVTPSPPLLAAWCTIFSCASDRVARTSTIISCKKPRCPRPLGYSLKRVRATR